MVATAVVGSSPCRLTRSTRRSHAILPEQSSSRSTRFGSTESSPSTASKVPSVKSSDWDTAALLRSIDFGVKTTSGLCFPLNACSRSRWK
jgi:hypothetical protein